MTTCMNLELSSAFRRRDLADVVSVTTDAEQASSAGKELLEDNFKQVVAMCHEIGDWSDTVGKYVFPSKVVEFFDGYKTMEEERIKAAYFGGRDRASLAPEQKKQFNKRLNAFTSNRSIITNAVTNGLPLLDENGFPLGKSALSTCVVNNKSPFAKYSGAINTASALAGKIDKPGELSAALIMAENMVRAIRTKYDATVTF